jgi:hypothetical protein
MSERACLVAVSLLSACVAAGAFACAFADRGAVRVVTVEVPVYLHDECPEPLPCPDARAPAIVRARCATPAALEEHFEHSVEVLPGWWLGYQNAEPIADDPAWADDPEPEYVEPETDTPFDETENDLGTERMQAQDWSAQ